MSESAVKLTLDTRSSAFNAKIPIPCLYEASLICFYQGFYSTQLDSAKPKVACESDWFQPELWR